MNNLSSFRRMARGQGTKNNNNNNRIIISMTYDIITKLSRGLEGVQAKLSFEGWKDYPLFAGKKVRVMAH